MLKSELKAENERLNKLIEIQNSKIQQLQISCATIEEKIENLSGIISEQSSEINRLRAEIKGVENWLNFSAD